MFKMKNQQNKRWALFSLQPLISHYMTFFCLGSSPNFLSILFFLCYNKEEEARPFFFLHASFCFKCSTLHVHITQQVQSPHISYSQQPPLGPCLLFTLFNINSNVCFYFNCLFLSNKHSFQVGYWCFSFDSILKHFL